MTAQKPKGDAKARAKSKPRRKAHLPDVLKAKALAVYREKGTVKAAMEAVKRSRKQWQRWMQEPEFAAEAKLAIEDYADSLEQVLDKRGVEKSDSALFFRLKALRPDIYRETIQHTIQGKVDHHHTLQLKLANLVPPDVALALQNPNTFRALLDKVKEPQEEPKQVGEGTTIHSPNGK
ncbi:MAG: hypothetical protein V3W44_08465 [Dehalococcoidales bacterium]